MCLCVSARVFGFNPGSPRLSLLACIPVAGRCLLRLRWLWRDRLAVSGTDGAVWLCPVPPTQDGVTLNTGLGRGTGQKSVQGSGQETGRESGKKSVKESVQEYGQKSGNKSIDESELRQTSSQNCHISPERGRQLGQTQASSEGSSLASNIAGDPLRLPALHQSGVNALEVLPDPRPGSVPADQPAGVSLLTGGDDGALCLSRLSADDRLTPGPRLAPAHASQVTGKLVTRSRQGCTLLAPYLGDHGFYNFVFVYLLCAKVLLMCFEKLYNCPDNSSVLTY